MNIRTDLALEQREVAGGGANGIESCEEAYENITVTHIRVTNPEGAAALGKPEGDYITIDIPPIDRYGGEFEGTTEIIIKELKKLLGTVSTTVLVVGIGNTDITPDALGPKTALGILATRHISHKMCRQLGLEKLKSVAVLAPGVLGQTGMEVREIISGAVANTEAGAVIAVDALAARRLSRLGRTIQLSNTGIIPGSGVGNSRNELSRATLGIPVISIGIPTVVDAQTLIYDLSGAQPQDSGEQSRSMIVTPREIDLMIDRAAELLSHSLNCFLQPDIDPEIIRALV